MMRLCEIVGLTYNDLVDITSYLLALIPFCVFIGILMYEAFDSLCSKLRVVIKKVYRGVVKHFPNVRKGRRAK